MPKFQFVKAWGPTLNRVNSLQEESLITVADVKRLAEFLDAEYEAARKRAKAKGIRLLTQTQWAEEIGMDKGTLSKYLGANNKEGPRTDILGIMARYFYKQYGEPGRKRFLQAAGVWGDDE